MKKVLSMLLVALMALSMLTFTTAEETDLEHVTLKFIFAGNPMSEADTVFAKIAETYQDQLNCDFEVSYINYGDLNQKLMVKVAAGEAWDMNFDSDWTGYYTMIANEAYMDLSELLPVYAPNLYAAYQEGGALKAATNANGEITALPWTMVMNHRPFFAVRKDFLEEAGLSTDLSGVTTVEQTLDILRQLKAAYPDKYMSEGISLDSFAVQYDLAEISHGLYYDLKDPDCKVMPIWETEAYQKFAEGNKTLQDDGLSWGDVLTDGHDGNNLMHADQMLAMYGTYEYARFNRPFYGDHKDTAEFVYTCLYPDNLYRNRTPLCNAMAIPVTAENPERTLMFMDLVETDQTMYDLLHYGIEGLTYILNEDGSASYPEGMDASTSNYMEWGGRWAVWKPQFMRPDGQYDEGFWEEEKRFAVETESNVDGALTGFCFMVEDISIEVAQCDQIYTDANNLIMHGLAGDPTEAVQKLIADEQDADIAAIVAECQAQVDAYLGK